MYVLNSFTCFGTMQLRILKPVKSSRPSTEGAIMKPNDETLEALVSDGLYELWEERASVLEFDAGLSRDLAEARAYLYVLRDHTQSAMEGLL
jgi:hypothetical protein